MTETVDVEEIRDALYSDEETRKEMFRELFDSDPDWSELEPLVDDFVAVFDEDRYTCSRSSGAISNIGSLTEEQCQELATYADPYENRGVACRAINAFTRVAMESPADVIPALPAIVTFLTQRDALEGDVPEDWTDSETIAEHPSRRYMQFHQEHRWKALATVKRVVEYDPTVLVDVEEELFTILQRPDRIRVHTNLLEAMGTAAEERPDLYGSFVEPLGEVLGEMTRPSHRANAAYVLAMLAEAHQDAVTETVLEHKADVFDMLMLGEDVEINASIGLLAYVAERSPEAVEPATDTVIELLEHPLESVRGNAIWTLSYVGGEEATEALERVAEEDPSEEIRTHATETHAQLASGE